MNLLKHTADRETFDRWTVDRLNRLVENLEQRARLIEKLYPRTTREAVSELRFRGFEVTESVAERMAELIGVGTIADTLVWRKSDVDHLAEFLENKLTIGSMHRVEDNISWEQDHAD